MSLNDLITRYTPESTLEEKQRILQSIAACLPAPEFLWLPVAIAALASEDLTLRRASLQLLAHAPQSWDTVLVAGLTTADAAFQTEAIAALAFMAASSSTRLQPFGALGALPGWLPEAHAAWETAWQALRSEEPPAAKPEDTAELESRLAAIEAERDKLAAAAARLEADLEAEREAHRDRETKLQTLDTEVREALERHEDEIESRRVIMEEMAEAHQRAVEHWRDRQRKTTAAAVAAALLVVVGVPGAWALGSKASVRAEEPRPVPIAAEPAEDPAAPPFAEVLREADDAGYRRAMSALAEKAALFKKEGASEQALAAWTLYAAIAPTEAESKLGEQEAAKLKAEPPKPAAKQPSKATKTATALKPPAPRHIVRQVPPPPSVRPVARRPAPPAPQTPPPAVEPPPAAPAPAEAGIPDHIRNKF